MTERTMVPTVMPAPKKLVLTQQEQAAARANKAMLDALARNKTTEWVVLADGVRMRASSQHLEDAVAWQRKVCGA